MVDFTRKITHEDYKNPEKLKKYYHRVEKKIHTKFKIYKETKYTKAEKILRNDNFIVTKSGSNATPEVEGGVSLAFLLMTLYYTYKDGLDNELLFFIVLSSLSTLFFAVYFFTMPKKEHILNRRDGLITMTGFFWQKTLLWLL